MKRSWLFIGFVTLFACGEIQLTPPQSLRSPTNIIVARGDICVTSRDVGGVTTHALDPCEDGAVGLVVNEQSDRVGLVNVTNGFPLLVDLDPDIPGVTHLNVGRLPVDIAASPDGTAAYTLNQLDRDISVIDLRTPSVLDERIHVDDTPIALDVNPVSGEVIVASGSPSTLRIFPGWTQPASDGEYAFEVTPQPTTSTVVELPGTVTDFAITPDGTTAVVTFRDFDAISLVTFDGLCLNPGQSAPCVSNNVSVTFDCNDGVDNDGDGLVDAQDAQCYGPTGAETVTGIARQAFGQCSNGMDDDADGLADRDDPDCLRPGMNEEPDVSEIPPVTQCNDGIDNDNDGQIDTADGNCYGAFGRNESPVRPLGLDRLAIDQAGVFAFAVDRVNSELRVIDLQQRRVIDAAASTIPRFDGFTDSIGIPVTTSPLDVTGFASRRQIGEDNAYRYSLGAWVSNDSGFLQFVEAADIYCQFPDDAVISELSEFYRGELSDAERVCLQVPTLPLASVQTRVDQNDPTLPAGCAEDSSDECQRGFVRPSDDGDIVTYFNPRFSLFDDFDDTGRVLGNRTCEQPQAVVDAMEEFARTNPRAPQKFKCDSPLMPQPLSLEVLDIEDESLTDELPRATPIERTRVILTDDDGTLVQANVSSVYDQSLASENWTVTYEGIIDGTSQADALLPQTIDANAPYVVETRLNACERGVEVDDLFIIRSTPDPDCEIDSSDDDDFWTFRITEVRPNALTLELHGDDAFTTELPDRECFSTGTSYEIRPVDTWVVSGEDSGFSSPRDSVFDFCESAVGDTSRRVGRVKTGETYVGPYLSFFLYPGFGGDEVPPVRDLSFTFSVERNFQSLRYDTQRPFPVGIFYAPGLSNDQDLLMSADAEANALFFQNLRDRSTAPSLLR